MTTTPTPLTGDTIAPSTSRREVWSWALWDWGTQPFATVITTFVFAPYIASAAFGTQNQTSTAVSIATGISGLLIAALAPVLGQNADRQGSKLRSLRWQTWLLALLSAALFFVRPEPSYLWPGLILLGIGTIISEIASVNYNALLDDVAGGRNIGRISGFGWGMGYLGGIVVLLLLFFTMIQPAVGLFGVTHDDSMHIRASMIICGVWTLLFTIPTFLWVRERPRGVPGPRTGIVASYRELFASIGRLWRTSRHTLWFLIASALYRDGLAGVFLFGGILAGGTFGFSPTDVIVFGAAANIVAGVSTMLFGLLDDRLGPKTVIVTSLVGLVSTGLLVFALHDRGQLVFWVCGLIMCMFVGPAQSASRSFLTRVAPEGRSGEVFGLYATTGRVVSSLSPFAFGTAVVLGARITGEANTQYWGILGVVLVLALGLAALLPIKLSHDSGHHTF